MFGCRRANGQQLQQAVLGPQGAQLRKLCLNGCWGVRTLALPGGKLGKAGAGEGCILPDYGWSWVMIIVKVLERDYRVVSPCTLCDAWCFDKLTCLGS
jgi:hypothetical protein